MKHSFPIRSFTSLLAVVLCAAPLWAHEAGSAADAMQWSWEPFVVGPILGTVLLYTVGIGRMWRRSGRRTSVWSVVAFAAGILALIAALDSPIHLLGGQLFWVHMTQHELLMLVGAPLLVLSRPVVPFLWSLPSNWREALGRFSKLGPWRKFWLFASSAAAAWTIHAVALWLWHAPVLFEAALHSEAVHAFQHVCFLGSALLFWWSLVHGRHGRMAYGAAIVYVFTTAAHNSILGALLTFAPRAWYPSYVGTAPNWNLTAIQDQQLGGLIMWVPAGTLLLIVGLALVAAWVGESQKRYQYTRMTALLKHSEALDAK